MKILFLYLGRKGAGPVYALEMAKALTVKNEVVAVLSNYIENKDNWDNSDGLQKYYYNTYKNRKQFVLSLFNWSLFMNIIKNIRKENPDVIYSPMPSLWDVFLFPLLKKYKRIKTIHDVVLHTGENGFISRFFHRQSFKHSEKFIILSKKYLSEMFKKGIESSRIEVIPHASFSYYNNHNVNEIYNHKSKKILFFGRIIKYKGLDVLLDALEIIRIKIPDIKLSIVGSGDVSIYEKQLNLLSQNVELHIRWISDDEVKEFFNDVSLVITPYIQASQSGVIPLAYSFGIPVVSSDVGCLSEQIIDGETGVLVPENDVELLAESIIKLLEQPQVLKKMSDHCIVYCKDLLSWEHSANLFNNFIKS